MVNPQNHIDISRTVPDTGLDLVFHASHYSATCLSFPGVEGLCSKLFSTRESAEQYLSGVRTEIAPESMWRVVTVPGVPKSTFMRVHLDGVEHTTQLRPIWASEV